MALEIKETALTQSKSTIRYDQLARWHYLWAALLFALLTLIFTWRMWGSLTIAVPGGDIDGFENVWNNWWIRKALLRLDSPFFTDYIYYPLGVSLRLHTLQPLNGFISLPFSFVFGYIGATNLILVFAVFATAFFSYVLFYYLTKNGLAATAGASFFAFCNWQLYDFFGAGQTNLISMQWLPLYLFFMLKAGREYREQSSLLQREGAAIRGQGFNIGWAALCLICITLIDLQYVVFSIILTGLYALYSLFTGHNWREKGLIWLRLALIGVAWAVVALPLVIMPALVETANAPWLFPKEGASISKATDLLDYLSVEGHNLGYIPLILAVIGLATAWRKSKEREGTVVYWGIAALFFGVLSLGTVLVVNDQVFTLGSNTIPLPYDLFNKLPGMGVGRNPSLFQIAWMLAIAAMATYGVSWLLLRIKGQVYWQVLATGALLAVTVTPILITEAGQYKLDTLGTSPFFEQMAQDKEDYAIYEIPPFTDKGRGENVYQAYQTIHQKARLGGRMARDHKLDNPNNFVKWNSLFRDFFWSEAIMKELRPPQDFLSTPDYKLVGLPLLNYYKVRYIILYKDALNEAAKQKAQALIAGILNNPKPYYEDSLLIAYQVPQVPSLTVNNGLVLDVGDGWFSAERNQADTYRWAKPQSTLSELYLYNLNATPKEAKLSFQAYSFKTERELIVKANGQIVGQYKLSEERQSFTLNLKLSAGRTLLTFSSPEPPLSVASFGFKNDNRALSFGVLGIRLE